MSVVMFEHVGPKNYGLYPDTAARHMKDEGLFLLHTIGSHETVACVDPWIERYTPGARFAAMPQGSLSAQAPHLQAAPAG